MNKEFKRYQADLLSTITTQTVFKHFREETIQAFMNIPRHEFVGNHTMEEAYYNSTLPLYEDDRGHVSTISQPSLVLKMIDLLELKPGMKVFELGAGSGWNAAMIGDIVGSKGKVISVEIIPNMAQFAQENLRKFNLPQVEIINGDGNEGYPTEAPFDRGIFTAGAYDVPEVFFEQIKEGGILEFVLKTESVDFLLVLKKVRDHFEGQRAIRCRFVPVKGKAPKPFLDGVELLSEESSFHIYPRGASIPSAGHKIIPGDTSSFVIF